MIRSIYQTAKRVVIWLGEATETTPMAFDVARRIVLETGRKVLRGEHEEITRRLANGAFTDRTESARSGIGKTMLWRLVTAGRRRDDTTGESHE